MANTTVGASVQVEFASVGQMRKAIKEATSDLIVMQEQFGKTSPQAIEAAKRIADLKDRIGDAKEQADLFDPGKRFSAFANAANQIAAGFSAVQGAMAIVGTESEDLQKTLVKVQGAVALSQGLSQLKDLGKAYDEIKIVAVDAFKSIRAAIGSTGIGLLVIALGTIVAYWDDIKEAVSGVSEEQKKLGVESKKGLKTEMDKVDALNNQDNILKLQGKSEKEILKDKIKQYDITIEKGKADLLIIEKEQEAREKAAARNAEITKQILTGTMQIATAGLRLLAAPIDALILTANKVSETLGFGKIATTTLNEELTGVIDKVSTFTTSFLFDPDKVKEEGKKTIKESQDTIKKLENDRAGLQLQIKEIDKKAADEKIAKDKTLAEKQKEAQKIIDDARIAQLSERQQEEAKILQQFEERKKVLQAGGIKDFTDIEKQRDNELKVLRNQFNKEDLAKAKEFQDQYNQLVSEGRLNSIKDERAKEIEQLNQGYEEKRKTIQENETLSFEQRLILLATLKENERLAMQQLEDKFAAEDEEKKIVKLEKEFEDEATDFARKKEILDIEAALIEEQFEKKAISETKYNEKVAALTEQRIKLGEAETEAKLQAADSVGNALGQMSKLAGEQTEAGRALAIAAATIDTFTSAVKAYKAGLDVPLIGMVMGPLNAALAVAAGVANIEKIASVKVDGKTGSGGTAAAASLRSGVAPMTAMPTPTVVAQTLNTQAINQLGNQSTRAYVLNSDMQSNEQRNAYLQRNARLG